MFGLLGQYTRGIVGANKTVDLGTCVLAIVLTAVSIAIATFGPSWALGAGIVAALIIDGIVLFWLLITAALSTSFEDGGVSRNHDDQARKTLIASLPSRPGAIFILLLFLVALISAFANIHAGVSALDSQSYSEESESRVVNAGWEAWYFAFVTLFSLNTQIEASSTFGRLAVITEFFSGILVLIAALPLLISRLATWDPENEPAPAPSARLRHASDDEIGLKARRKKARKASRDAKFNLDMTVYAVTIFALMAISYAVSR